MSVMYRPCVQLAEGGMAEIWLGVLEGAGDYKRAVVMKRARGDDETSRARARRALADEARLMAWLSHPNIVHTYALIEVQGEPYLVMEYLPGLSARALLRGLAEKKASLPAQVAYRIVADVARALGCAHEATDGAGMATAIIHGDISPENIVVTESGITKVVDFGVAQRSGVRSDAESLGKVCYASLEQLRSETLTTAADVFSLGVVTCELLLGAPPFLRPTEEQTAEAILRDRPPELPPTVAPAARDVIDRMLVRAAEHRTVTIDEVASVFEACALDMGASHVDVALFVRGEFAATLQARRLRLRALLEQPASVAPVPARRSTGSTTLAVEAVLDDAPIPTTGPKHPPLGDD